ncbi:MAG TPA: LPS export ABC transporter periplasmic protein LptC [Abditibacteriaceae bacterium]|jgi:LPS export ABC transporter protein LptC
MSSFRIDASARRFWTVPAAALGLAAVSWWALQPLPDNKKTNADTPPAIEATGARSIVVRENGRKAWEFAAQRITVDASRTRARADNVEKGVIFQNGKALWNLRATRVDLNQLTRDVDAKDAVASLAARGLRITTPRAIWKHSSKLLLCPQPLQAQMKNLDVKAQGASYNVARGELRCTSGVEVTSPFGTLSSPRATASPSTRTVTFQGGVDIVIRRSALPVPTGG